MAVFPEEYNFSDVGKDNVAYTGKIVNHEIENDILIEIKNGNITKGFKSIGADEGTQKLYVNFNEQLPSDQRVNYLNPIIYNHAGVLKTIEPNYDDNGNLGVNFHGHAGNKKAFCIPDFTAAKTWWYASEQQTDLILKNCGDNKTYCLPTSFMGANKWTADETVSLNEIRKPDIDLISEWSADTVYNVNDVVKPPNSDGSHFFICRVGGTSGSSEPTWKFDCNTDDNGVKWDYTFNDTLYKCVVDGATGSVQPIWNCCKGENSVDNEVTWEAIRPHSIVDMYSAAIPDQQVLRTLAASGGVGINSITDFEIYVKVNNVPVANGRDRTFFPYTGDFSVDYENGCITFHQEKQPTDVIKFSGAITNCSIYEIIPAEGRKLRLSGAKMLFDDSFDLLRDTISDFKIMAGNDQIGLKVYESVDDLRQEADEEDNIVPLGTLPRGFPWNGVRLRWLYPSEIVLLSSQSQKIIVCLRNDRPVPGNRVRATLFGVSENE